MPIKTSSNADTTSACPYTSRSQSSFQQIDNRGSSASSVSSCSSRGNYNLIKDQILVKISHVNEAMLELKTKVYDDEDKEECHFVRIIRIGPETKNDLTLPGTLVVVQQNRGTYLEDLSQEYGESYYLLLESDIKTYIDL